MILILFASTQVNGRESSLDQLVVVLDPGHGGSQQGAVGKRGLQEKDLVLSIALRARKALQKVSKLKVVMTRECDLDMSLDERIELANRVNGDVFISIHANAFVKSHISGVETFFHSVEASDEEAKRVALFENSVNRETGSSHQDPLGLILEDMQRAEKLRDSSRLAHFVQDELVQRLPFENRGVLQADFMVLDGTRMPSILIEIGFLSSPKDEKTLMSDSVRDKAAQAIRAALLRYWALVRNKSVPDHIEKESGQ